MLRQRADQLVEEFAQLEADMAGGSNSGGAHYTPENAQKFNRLSGFVENYDTYKSYEKDYKELESMIEDANEDPEIKEEASKEKWELEVTMNKLLKVLKKHVSPARNPFIDRSTILELRPGVGGSEAMLFCQELLNMYTNYASKKRWRTQLISVTENPAGGITEAILTINKPGSYAMFQYEGGVHRVQRVPATESKGRVHTSTAAVVVLPQMNSGDSKHGGQGNPEESDEAEKTFAPGEVRIDVMRASGAGGQHVNRTESAVRLTHIPTGIVVSMQDARSQHKNKAKAFMILRARIADRERLEQIEIEKRKRTSQVSTTRRSYRIRTYNFNRKRVSDHRCRRSWFFLPEFLRGEVEPFEEVVETMDTIQQERALKELIAAENNGVYVEPEAEENDEENENEEEEEDDEDEMDEEEDESNSKK